RRGGAGLLAFSSAVRSARDPSLHASDWSAMKSLLIIGGVLHFVILIASALTPRVLDWRANLASLHPFLRRLFWVYGSFIVLVIISFGTLTLLRADELASTLPLARSVCAMIALFWL